MIFVLSSYIIFIFYSTVQVTLAELICVAYSCELFIEFFWALFSSPLLPFLGKHCIVGLQTLSIKSKKRGSRQLSDFFNLLMRLLLDRLAFAHDPKHFFSPVESLFLLCLIKFSRTKPTHVHVVCDTQQCHCLRTVVNN